MPGPTKRSFGVTSGDVVGPVGSSGNKKAKPSVAARTAPIPSRKSAFDLLMTSATTKSTIPATTFNPENPAVIRVPSDLTLEHWLWLDPFAERSDRKGEEGGSRLLKPGLIVHSGDGVTVDADEEIEYIGRSEPQPNAIAGPSTIRSPARLPPQTPSISTKPYPTPSSPDHLPAPPVKPSIPTTCSPPFHEEKIKLALFDLDGTLIGTRSAARFPKGPDDWKFLYGGDGEGSTKGGLRGCWEDGYHLIILSNQNLNTGALDNWRKKIVQICANLPGGIPLRILAANQKDHFRKPQLGMFETVQKIYRARGLEIDMQSSFYVGDAAGRTGGRGQAQDHTNTDYTLALNAGLRFLTPEQFFKKDTSDQRIPHPKGFDARAYLKAMEHVPEVTPTTSPIVPKDMREIVLFVGSPAAGKTTFFNRYFRPKGYTHVNQDTLKSRDRCLARVGEVLGAVGGGGGCVVDNTNRDVSTRRHYVQLAKRFGVPIRCFRFMASPEVAMHNNAYRAWCQRGERDRTILPPNAIYSFSTSLEPPTASEGFSEIRQVQFHFEGEEEDVRRWCLWMS